jgi:hypothetical protein
MINTSRLSISNGKTLIIGIAIMLLVTLVGVFAISQNTSALTDHESSKYTSLSSCKVGESYTAKVKTITQHCSWNPVLQGYTFHYK